eukprot:4204855-Pyramimonas_sp.AAC.1
MLDLTEDRSIFSDPSADEGKGVVELLPQWCCLCNATRQQLGRVSVNLVFKLWRFSRCDVALQGTLPTTPVTGAAAGVPTL